jgi:hypothetical protein
MNSILQDLRFGFPMLAKTPGFSAIAIVTLALGIGANTAIFSAVNGIILKPLPFANPSQLIRVVSSKKNGDLMARRLRRLPVWRAKRAEGSAPSLASEGESLRVALLSSQRAASALRASTLVRSVHLYTSPRSPRVSH